MDQSEKTGCSILIFLAGYEIVHTVFFETAQLNRGTLPYAMAGVLLTMAITFAFSRYELAQGKQIGSPSLMADAQHIRTDMLSSGVILAGLLVSILGWDLDKFAALLVVVLIAKAAIAILVDALRVLLDASIDFKTMDQVKTIIMINPRLSPSMHSGGESPAPINSSRPLSLSRQGVWRGPIFSSARLIKKSGKNSPM
ncbi:MAG: cation transporter [Deltaproteobacteria bacterium]|nr:cation transporter [Deltaproteobacteria bacterium]